MDSNHETQYIIFKIRGCHSIFLKKKKNPPHSQLSTYPKKKKKRKKRRRKNKGWWINSRACSGMLNLQLNSSPFKPKIQSAPCPKQTFPCSEVCTCTTHKSNVLNFIHSPFNFLAQHFQYYFIMLIDHIALDSSYAHY